MVIPPSMTLWQEKQETVPVAENRGSKKSILPSSTFSTVVGLFTGNGAESGNASHVAAAWAANSERTTISGIDFMTSLSMVNYYFYCTNQLPSAWRHAVP